MSVAKSDQIFLKKRSITDVLLGLKYASDITSKMQRVPGKYCQPI